MNVMDELRRDAGRPLGEARSLPFAAYRDSEVLAAERDRLFHADWVFVCNAGEIPDPGDYYALTLAGEPIAVLRGADGTLRVLSNVCRHRGAPLLDQGFGRVGASITCPYHAWTYDQEGALDLAPFAQRVPVDREAHCLPRFAVSTWHGLVFVNLSQNPVPLAARLEGIEPYIRVFEPDGFTQSYATAPQIWQSNWKLVMENGVDSYHLFKVHRDTLEKYVPSRDAYYVAGGSEWSLTGGRTVRELGWPPGLPEGGYPEVFDHYLLISLPPSFVGVLSYGSLEWIAVDPVDASTTRVRAGGISLPGLGEDADEQAFTEAFFAEDKDICERVQEGMGARLSRGGQLVDLEQVVVDLHRYVTTRLFELPAAETMAAPEGRRFLDASPGPQA